MIYTFKPFSTTKDIGQAYNGHCELVPHDDDWILIMDTDTMMISPELAYPIIEKAIARYPDTWIFGAMTNRVSYSRQRVKVEIDTDPNTLNHYHRTKVLAETFSDGECRDAPTVAGFFLLFRKAYWKVNKFQDKIFDKDGKLFDYNFCRTAQSARRVRIILGVYIFHFYRLHKSFMDKTHLQ